MTDTKRLDDLEAALVLWIALSSGQPEDATAEETDAARKCFAEIMTRIQQRVEQAC